MQAQGVMTANVISVWPDATVTKMLSLLLEPYISAVLVLDETGRVEGVVSKGELIHDTGRAEDNGSWL